VIADKANDAQGRMIEPLLKGWQDGRDSPAQGSAHYDRDLYKARHLIENFFAKLKQYRVIATRYDRTARNFFSTTHLATAVIWLN
jgi:hypothetical protein